jgi:hypothetical protein
MDEAIALLVDPQNYLFFRGIGIVRLACTRFIATFLTYTILRPEFRKFVKKVFISKTLRKIYFTHVHRY